MKRMNKGAPEPTEEWKLMTAEEQAVMMAQLQELINFSLSLRDALSNSDDPSDAIIEMARYIDRRKGELMAKVGLSRKDLK